MGEAKIFYQGTLSPKPILWDNQMTTTKENMTSAVPKKLRLHGNEAPAVIRKVQEMIWERGRNISRQVHFI